MRVRGMSPPMAFKPAFSRVRPASLVKVKAPPLAFSFLTSRTPVGIPRPRGGVGVRGRKRAQSPAAEDNPGCRDRALPRYGNSPPSATLPWRCAAPTGKPLHGGALLHQVEQQLAGKNQALEQIE